LKRSDAVVVVPERAITCENVLARKLICNTHKIGKAKLKKKEESVWKINVSRGI